MSTLFDDPLDNNIIVATPEAFINRAVTILTSARPGITLNQIIKFTLMFSDRYSELPHTDSLPTPLSNAQVMKDNLCAMEPLEKLSSLIFLSELDYVKKDIKVVELRDKLKIWRELIFDMNNTYSIRQILTSK